MGGLLAPQALADRWDCSTKWLANMRTQGRGPAFVKIGSLVRYRLADVEAFEAQRAVQTLDSVRA